MARIAYLLLAHKNPEETARLALTLTEGGHYVSIHYDKRSQGYDILYEKLNGNPNIVFAKRVRGGWGGWSLVQGTLNALQLAEKNFPDAAFFYLLSGDCAPIKPHGYIENYLKTEDKDFIQSFDFVESGWIQTGIISERFTLYHPFNEREYKALFYWWVRAQRYLKIKRKVPNDLQMMIGSQWWALRRQTVEKLLQYLKMNPHVIRFFKTVWIPDECFFQTIVNEIVADKEIVRETPTFLKFSDYGLPFVFYPDHFQMLKYHNQLFVRKLSNFSHELRDECIALYKSDENLAGQVTNQAGRIIGYVVRQGRFGHRYQRRIWETANTLGSENTLYVIVAKKWHVGKRFADMIGEQTDLSTFGYIFNERNAGLPDMGGSESTIHKRRTNVRGLVSSLFAVKNTKELVLCLDPSDSYALGRLLEGNRNYSMLFIDTEYDQAYLQGHSERLGLVNDKTPEKIRENLISVVERELRAERETIISTYVDKLSVIGQSFSDDENEQALLKFCPKLGEKARLFVSEKWRFG